MTIDYKASFPVAWALFEQSGHFHSPSVRTLYGFFDDHGIHIVPTRYTGMPKPWGYEVYGVRFVRHEAAYEARLEAEKAGFQTGFEELTKLLNEGNK